MTLGPQFDTINRANNDLAPTLFDTSPYETGSQSPQTYIDNAGRSRIVSTSILPEWWHDEYGYSVDPEFNTPNAIMKATRHIRGVDGDFVVADKAWKGDDTSDVIWHGSPSRIEDGYVSSAESAGQTHRYEGIDGLEDFRGGWHDKDKVWGGAWSTARDYAGGHGNEGYMYGLDVQDPDLKYTSDGYAFDEGENTITQRYRMGDQ